jgi:GNAT superfamily N-acetyltransferase
MDIIPRVTEIMTGKSEYNETNLSFCQFREKHMPFIKSIKTTDADLREFLFEDALRSQEHSISKTFLIFAKAKVVGYITILNDATRLDADLKEKFKEKGYNYKSIPALKIGRLCVDDDYVKRGVGTTAMKFAARRAVFLNLQSACRFINVDATRHAERERDTLHFYKRFGFEVLKERKGVDAWRQTSGITPMYLDLYHIIEMFRKDGKL